MKVALVRIGIDSGSGGLQGPLFQDGSFEYIPIPDGYGNDTRTYGNMVGRHSKRLVDYFPLARRARMAEQSVHVDPEFATFTYGDPTPPKAGLRCLEQGDMLVFYCGLEGWDFRSEPALYIMGYFDVLEAGKANGLGSHELKNLCSENFHVRHPGLYEEQKDALVLVKGSSKSRLLKKACLISTTGRDCAGRPLKILSPEMQESLVVLVGS